MGIPNGENCIGNAFCRHIIVLILGIYIVGEYYSVEKIRFWAIQYIFFYYLCGDRLFS